MGKEENAGYQHISSSFQNVFKSLLFLGSLKGGIVWYGGNIHRFIHIISIILLFDIIRVIFGTHQNEMLFNPINHSDIHNPFHHVTYFSDMVTFFTCPNREHLRMKPI